MLSPSHLHFRALSPEARHSALQRLVWRGFDPRTISERTGVPETEVRRVIEANAITPTQPIEAALFISGSRSRQRRH